MKLKDARSLRSRPGPSPRRWRRGASARRRPTTRRCARCCPTWRSSGIAQRQPTTVDELAQARGVDERHRRGRIGREIVAAVAAGKAAEPPAAPDAVDELDRSKRPAITLVSAWVSQVARDASRSTPRCWRPAPTSWRSCAATTDARLAHGWRAELVGDGLTRLMEGRAGLTFDGKGSLRLIDV